MLRQCNVTVSCARACGRQEGRSQASVDARYRQRYYAASDSQSAAAIESHNRITSPGERNSGSTSLRFEQDSAEVKKGAGSVEFASTAVAQVARSSSVANSTQQRAIALVLWLGEEDSNPR